MEKLHLSNKSIVVNSYKLHFLSSYFSMIFIFYLPTRMKEKNSFLSSYVVILSILSILPTKQGLIAIYTLFYNRCILRKNSPIPIKSVLLLTTHLYWQIIMFILPFFNYYCNSITQHCEVKQNNYCIHLITWEQNFNTQKMDRHQSSCMKFKKVSHFL